MGVGSLVFKGFFLIAFFIILATTMFTISDLVLSVLGTVNVIFVFAIIIFASYISLKSLYRKMSANIILVCSIILPILLNIVSATLAWGNTPLGHEDYLRDVEWASLMDYEGLWRSEKASGALYTVYALFPAHSFMLYIFNRLALSGSNLLISGLILLLLLKMLNGLILYIFLKCISVSYREAILLLLPLTIGGTTVSAQLFSIILVLLIFYVLAKCILSRTHPISYTLPLLLILLAPAVLLYHPGEASAFFILSAVFIFLLAIRAISNVAHTLKIAFAILILTPLVYLALNAHTLYQIYGFIIATVRALHEPHVVRQLEFVASLEFYKSPIWHIRHYEIILYFPLLLLFTKRFIVALLTSKEKALGAPYDNVLLLFSASTIFQGGLGLLASFITRNSVYFRYLFIPISTVIVLMLIDWIEKLEKSKFKHIIYATLTLLLIVSALLVQLFHMSAPLLHVNMDIVNDIKNYKTSLSIKMLSEKSFSIKVFSILAPIGENPYESSDYWILQYNLERGNIPNNSIIFVASYKEPLGRYLHEFCSQKMEHLNILFSSGPIYLAHYP